MNQDFVCLFYIFEFCLTLYSAHFVLFLSRVVVIPDHRVAMEADFRSVAFGRLLAVRALVSYGYTSGL